MTIIYSETEFVEMVRKDIARIYKQENRHDRVTKKEKEKTIDARTRMSIYTDTGSPKSYPCDVELETVEIDDHMCIIRTYTELKATFVDFDYLKETLKEMEKNMPR